MPTVVYSRKRSLIKEFISASLKLPSERCDRYDNLTFSLPDEIIDNDNSEYEYHDEEEVGFKVLNFLEEKIPAENLLFCAENDLAYNIYCDDQFRELVEAHDLKGLHFNPTLIDPYFK